MVDTRAAVALALVLVTLAVVNVTRSTVVPSGAHLAYNLATAAAVVGIGVAAGLGTSELGLSRATLPAGLRLGGLVVAVILVAVVLAAVLPGLSRAFDDQRADLSFGELVLKAAVVIPIGTVLVEELIFRGVVLGLLRRLASPWVAVAWASVVFGLWHVFPAWRAQADNALLEQTSRGLTVLGTFLATTAAGVFFCWLRQRSGSLAAPMLAHVGTNSVPLVVAWFATR